MNVVKATPHHEQYLALFYQWLKEEWQDIEPPSASKDGLIIPPPILALDRSTLMGGLIFTRFLSPTTHSQAIWINALFVAPNARHQGIASQLIRHAESYVYSLNEAELLVYTHIPNLYVKQNWIEVEKNGDHVVLQSTFQSNL
ncbi:GNAT family N-acetyltransferase [Vibrio methylphosphonaticus]|uniref:GNAT family N-acetyltransferase n=1 Tax=Vibrio methylphosphonaticus TaxID=2946866 RepID=UPI00202A2AAC|nr:GNAT family N-acetyltransferase [Vibrio methylphosphonaticus]MCL9774464.1 GNAT family N-acetyltransferase [Vibrio methylphosphonaticus]